MDLIAAFPITIALIAANLVASLVAFFVPDFFNQNVFKVGPILRQREWHRVITSGFLHVNGLHLFVNMYVLLMFGPYLEQSLGTAGYLFVYMAALIGASLWMLYDKRDEPDYSAVGASGAVSGVLTAFSLLAPFTLLYLFFLVPVPAILFAAGFIAISAWLAQRGGSMVAHGAHLGGAVIGIAATILWSPDVLVRLLAGLGGGAD